MFGAIQKKMRQIITLGALLTLFIFGQKFVSEYLTMRHIVKYLKADSRIAEVLVVESKLDEFTRQYTTTIKFLEYDVKGLPMKPKYFTFKGNLIQFQTLVVRFDDRYIEQGHRLKGKSIYLFLKAFYLDGERTQEFEITPRHQIPDGYRVGNPPNYFEKEVWAKFWKLALDPELRRQRGVKNAQIEAPGSVFVPGTIYTLMIEHDGGIRIDTRPIPEILKANGW